MTEEVAQVTSMKATRRPLVGGIKLELPDGISRNR